MIGGGPGEDTVAWLHWKLKHTSQGILWEVVKAWSLPLCYADVVGVCQSCPICAEIQHHWLPQMAGSLQRGETTMTPWQIDYQTFAYNRRSPVHPCMDTTTGIMQAYLSKKANQ